MSLLWWLYTVAIAASIIIAVVNYKKEQDFRKFVRDARREEEK